MKAESHTLFPKIFEYPYVPHVHALWQTMAVPLKIHLNLLMYFLRNATFSNIIDKIIFKVTFSCEIKSKWNFITTSTCSYSPQRSLLKINLKTCKMDMELPKPRVNASMFPKFQGKVITFIGIIEQVIRKTV